MALFYFADRNECEDGSDNCDENVHKDIKYALSAMTALVQLQADDYQLIKF